MESNAVLPRLEAPSGKAMRFLLDGKQLVPNDFHVTEVKRVSVASLDCGGGARAWRELVVQLWSPRSDDTQAAMTAATFLSILRRAEALDFLNGDALRFEYGSPGEPAVQYHLGHIVSDHETLDVHLTPPQVACRPLELALAEACCAPNTGGACCA